MQALKSTWAIRAAGGVLLLGLTVGAFTTWCCRARLEAWYQVRLLAEASDEAAPPTIARLVALGDGGLAGVLGGLSRDDERLCGRLEQVLYGFEKQDPESVPLETVYRGLSNGFPAFQLAGQQAVLRFTGTVLAEPEITSVPPPLADILVAALQSGHTAVRVQALIQARLLCRLTQPELHQKVRDLVQLGLRDQDVDARTQAVRLAVQVGPDLRSEVMRALEDPSAPVRQAAIMAIGNIPELIASDDLFRWLHDPDAEVRRLCEQALRNRGLLDSHLKLGRLLTDTRAPMRLLVVEQLRRTPDLAPAIWLRRLSHDTNPAVRAAALRGAAEDREIDFQDRLQQMAQNDPSATVKQLAQHYLKRHAERANSGITPVQSR